MLHTLMTSVKDGIRVLLKHPQLILTLALVIVIPVSFLLSGQQFLHASKANQERLEKDRIGLMHDLLTRLIVESDLNAARLQEHVFEIMELNPDITKLRISVKNEDQFIPFVAEDVLRISKPETYSEPYKIASARTDESLIFESVNNSGRVWQAYRTVLSGTGAPPVYIFTETSLSHIDALFASRVQQAYIYLIFIVLFVLLLVFRHVRIIDYSYLYKELQEVIKTRDLFTHTITHELRAPLTAMRGYASLIRENTKASKKVKEQAGVIEESATRLVHLVNDLLDVARIQSGKLSMKKTSLNLHEQIAHVLKTLEAEAKEKKIKLINEVSEEILLAADRDRLIQIITNIVSNSIKYTEKGSVTVVAEELEEAVTIRVQDTGMGIASKDQRELFAPFYRVDNTSVEKITGTGLGMWITRQLVEAMGGTIGVESIKGVGTHVVITLTK